MTTVSNSTILQKLCEKVSVSPSNIDPNINVCLICNTALNAPENIQVLDCNHKFHYGCIHGWYKTCATKAFQNSNNFKVQTCPYCRKKGGWLPKKDGFPETEYVNFDHVKKANIALNKKQTLPKLAVVKKVKQPPIICCAQLKVKKGAPPKKCSHLAHYPDITTGTIKYCGVHKTFTNKIHCCATTASGIPCKNTAKYPVAGVVGPNMPAPIVVCGVHKNKLAYQLTIANVHPPVGPVLAPAAPVAPVAPVVPAPMFELAPL